MKSNTIGNLSFNFGALKAFWITNNHLISIGKIIIATGLLIYIVSVIKISEIYDAIQAANYYLLIVVVLLGFLNIYLQFYKWKLTVNKILKEHDTKKIFYSLFYGFSAGVFTPGRIGEYFGRAIGFNNKSFLRITLATLLDKLFPLIVIGLIGSISSVIFIYYYYQIDFYITLSLFVLIMGLFSFLFWIIFNDNIWNKLLFEKLDSIKVFNLVFKKITVFKDVDKNYATKMMLISLLFFLCFVLQYALLVITFSHHNNLGGYMVAGVLIMFSKSFIPPISIAEIGVREGLSVFFIGLIGEASTTGFNASIFLFLINVLLPSIIGLFFLMRKNAD